MLDTLSKALEVFLHRIRARRPLVDGDEREHPVRDPLREGEEIYRNRNLRLGVDFSVERLDFLAAQTLDPRVVRIAPGANNERHKHAHESLFVILEGQGEVVIGERRSPVRRGDLVFVPRWVMHQTCNSSGSRPLVLLAITDFGVTSAVLGDYDRRTRLRHGGEDAKPTHPA
jgi:mannose-6-phosphate isomerase-like protein (cupin superfamily)